MKVAVLTFRWANNYGALLQAYGLRRALEALGAEVVFPDYAPAGSRVPWWRPLGVRQGVFLQAGLMKYRCAGFRRDFLPATRRCDSMADLSAACQDCDAVVTGSDQVWNGNGPGGFNPVYFLGFPLPARCRRISYAACFGQTDQPPATREGARNLLGSLNSISVRNILSRELVRQLSDRDAEVVLDPTLLHDYADLDAGPTREGGYILVYSLGAGHRSLGEWIVARAKQKLGLPVVTLYPDARFRGTDRHALSAGPREWLRLVKGATMVITNSFHGTTFALGLGKRFIVWGGARPDRLEDILRRAGALDHLILQKDEARVDALIGNSPVPDRLGPERDQSLSFLKGALS